MTTLVLSFLTAFFLVLAISPGVIRLAHRKGLVDRPTGRSSHEAVTPCVGGVPVFIGILFTTLLVLPQEEWREMQYILSALILVFMIGLKDDLEGLTPFQKVVGLIVASGILVIRGDVCLDGLYGLFAVTASLPTWLCWIISGFTLLVITNSFNLIDGIDGLSATLGTIACLTFGAYFFLIEELFLCVLALTTAGGLLAFLRFNLTPARTFMGDTGALVVGLIVGVLAIKFIDLAGRPEVGVKFYNPVAVAVGVLIVPLFDTLRVFTARVIRGRSPFRPDRRHVHHLLIDGGLDHLSATAVLAFFTMASVSTTFYLDAYLGLHALLALQTGVSLLAVFGLTRWVRRRGVNRAARRLKTVIKTPAAVEEAS